MSRDKPARLASHMSWCYRHLVRPLFFAHDPEQIHQFTLQSLRCLSRSEVLRDLLQSYFAAPALPVSLWGLTFPNPVGLAAGMDKFAEALPAWETIGFGSVELGTITWHEQPGNPQPRLFRAVAQGALVNRMGFNNPGAAALAESLRHCRAAGCWPRHPVGINLGKSKVTPLQEAAADYAKSFHLLQDQADFFVVNVSSPNTPGLRQLQDKSALDEILAALQEVNRNRTAPKPILVKVAPDLSWRALDEILQITGPRQVSGLVATNTTLARPPGSRPECRRVFQETGGLSGQPLRDSSTQVIRHLYRRTQGRLPIVGVGGIFSAADAWTKILAGASLVQVYTGLVFEGPALLREIVQGLQQRLARYGLRHLQEAVGLGVRDPEPEKDPGL